jgi:3-hydroxyisobutyrate dehydrogenase-like beta-hydroxyacid dehydrogenase
VGKLTTGSRKGIAIKIGFLASGNMGMSMALRLLAAGHELSVGNRSEAAASRQTRLSLADQMAEIFAEAARIGPASQDWAMGQSWMAQRRGVGELVNGGQ